MAKQQRDRLEALKAKMSDQQRKDMSELLSNELKRRNDGKSKVTGYGASPLSGQKSKVKGSSVGGLASREDLAEIYAELEQRKKEIAARKASGGVTASLSGLSPKISFLPLNKLFRFPTFSKRALVLAGVLVFASLKVLSSTGVVKASVDKAPKFSAEASQLSHSSVKQIDVPASKSAENVEAPSPVMINAAMNASEKEVLTDLDKRRVELERRRQNLEEREGALKEKEQEILANLAELRSLTRKIQDHQKEKDRQYEARMEQLANVYSSMAPKEAAPLVGKLDDSIALALLQRMPGKRMGQILSMMNPERAIELTRLLTDKEIS